MSNNQLAATTVLPKVLYSGQLPDTADHSLYSPAAGTAATIQHATICNATGSAVTITAVSIVPSGGSADGTHRVISGYSLAANDSMAADELIGCRLGPGDAIHAQAGTGAAVDIVISGEENS